MTALPRQSVGSITPTGPHGTSLRILHIDMDAFFAAVEQRDNPQLRGRPVVIGGSPFSRGVVSTASYEARRFGIRSAMAASEAHRLCPQAVFLRPDISKYSRVSRHIRAIFHRRTDLVEPLSLDEAFLDVAGRDAVQVGREIKAEIRDELGLTGSVGLSYCKFLAKIASDMDKPDGFTVIDADRALSLLPTLPVRRLWGVGPRTEGALHHLGLKTFADLLAADAALLRSVFGRRTDEMLLLAHGIDHRAVEPRHDVKSIGEETTFPRDLSPLVPAERTQLLSVLEGYAGELAAALHRRRLRARTVTVKVRFQDFRTITRSQTQADAIDEVPALAQAAREIFDRVDFQGQRVRLLGLSVSNLLQPGELVQMRFPL